MYEEPEDYDFAHTGRGDLRNPVNGRTMPVDLESYDQSDDDYERDYNSYDKWYA